MGPRRRTYSRVWVLPNSSISWGTIRLSSQSLYFICPPANQRIRSGLSLFPHPEEVKLVKVNCGWGAQMLHLTYEWLLTELAKWLATTKVVDFWGFQTKWATLTETSHVHRLLELLKYENLTYVHYILK